MMFEASVVTSIPSLWSAVNSWFTPAVLFLLLNIMIGTIALTSTLTSSHDQNQEEHTHHHNHQHQQEDGQQEETHHVPVPLLQPLSKSPSIIERVKSLKLFSPKSQQPLIPPSDEVPGEIDAQKDPVQKQAQGPPRSPSSLGKIKPFDLYSYLPQEPTSEISRETNTHYISEQNHQESSFSHEREEKGEEKKAEEEKGEEEEEAEEGYEGHTEVPANVVPRSIRRSESLNVRFTFPNLKEDARGGFDEVDVEAMEKRRPATMREGKAKWGAGDEEVDARADDFINRFKEQLKLQRMDSLARQKDLMISKVSAAKIF